MHRPPPPLLPPPPPPLNIVEHWVLQTIPTTVISYAEFLYRINFSVLCRLIFRLKFHLLHARTHIPLEEDAYVYERSGVASLGIGSRNRKIFCSFRSFLVCAVILCHTPPPNYPFSGRTTAGPHKKSNILIVLIVLCFLYNKDKMEIVKPSRHERKKGICK